MSAPQVSPDLQAAVRDVLAAMLDELAARVAGQLGAATNSAEHPAKSPEPEQTYDPEVGQMESALPSVEVAAGFIEPEAAAVEKEPLSEPLESSIANGESPDAPPHLEASPVSPQPAAESKTDLLMAKIWPRWLDGDELTVWKERLESELFAPDAPPSLGLLFAALHGYSAALPDSDPKTLWDALRDVGRRLYVYLCDHDERITESDCATIAELWAAAINKECAGRCEVEVPVPGNAANSQWMIFQPRGGSSPDILAVRSWCVRDAQKRPVHRAEVSV